MRLKVVAIFLICIFLALSILDAPEYVRCMDVGICEFLELHAHSVYILNLDVMRHHSHEARNNFFSILEDIVDSKEFDKDITVCNIHSMLNTFKTFYPSIIRKDMSLLNKHKRFTSGLSQNPLKEQTLEIVEISVILS